MEGEVLVNTSDMLQVKFEMTISEKHSYWACQKATEFQMGCLDCLYCMD